MQNEDTLIVVKKFIYNITFWLTIIVLGLVILYSDKPVSSNLGKVFLYDYEIIGLDPLDWLTLILMALISIHLFLKIETSISKFHKYMFFIFFIYILAMINGYIYGIFFDYPYKRWFQDIQHVSYALVFFIITFEICEDTNRWNIFLKWVFFFIAIKTLAIGIDFFKDKGAYLFATTVVTARGADLIILPTLFYPAIAYLGIGSNGNRVKRAICMVFALLFIFDIVINIGRTTWLLFIISIVYFISELRPRARIKLLLSTLLMVVLVVAYIQVKYPKFISFGKWRLTSTVDISITYENISNATRVIEAKNITYRLFKYCSLIQGMGLGAWWDDEAFGLPPGDLGSGFIGEKRHFYTHLWFLTQLLKIGLIGTLIYYFVVVKMFISTRRLFRGLEDNNKYKPLLLGLNIAFFNMAFCAAGFIRIFLFMGVILALIARLHSFAVNEE